MSWWLRADDDDEEALPLRTPAPPPPAPAPALPYRHDIDFAKHRDGSIAAFACDATGVRFLRTCDNEILLEIDRPGEEAIFVQVRGVGRDVAGVRAMFTGEAG